MLREQNNIYLAAFYSPQRWRLTILRVFFPTTRAKFFLNRLHCDQRSGQLHSTMQFKTSVRNPSLKKPHRIKECRKEPEM